MLTALLTDFMMHSAMMNKSANCLLHLIGAFDVFLYLLCYNSSYIPDEIAGDLDSLRDDVREYYEKRVMYK